MSSGYIIRDQYAPHFITPTIVDWVDVFTRKAYIDIVMQSLAYCIQNKSLKLYGYVVKTIFAFSKQAVSLQDCACTPMTNATIRRAL